VLEIGCGTGIDTVHLATHGIRVTGIDLSAKMLDELRAKVVARSLQAVVDVRLGDSSTVLPQLSGHFDGLFSSFAAVNMIDLAVFAREAARLVRPGGRMICHMLSPGYVAGPLARLAARYLRRDPVHDDAVTLRMGGERVVVSTLPATELYRRLLAQNFIWRDAYALGFLVRGSFEDRLPARVLEGLGRIETVVGSAPMLTSVGRFFVLDVERRR
jgi:SAM-dependent methyltransferase